MFILILFIIQIFYFFCFYFFAIPFSSISTCANLAIYTESVLFKWINPIIYQPQRADIAQNMIEMELYDFETGKI
jgi:hypothetical protein